MNRQEIVTLLQLQSGMKLIRAHYLDNAQNFAPAPQPPQPASTKRGYEPGAPTPPFEHLEAVHGYVFKCLTVDYPSVGDLVVVETANGSFALAKISQVGVQDPSGTLNYAKLRHVVGKVSLDALDHIAREEGRVMERLAMAEINKRLSEVRSLYGDLGSLLTSEPVQPPNAPTWTPPEAPAEGSK